MSDVNKTLEELLNLIKGDVAKIKKIAKNNPETLDKIEASKITDYTKTLLAVSKEERESLKQEDIQAKSDDELTSLAKQALDFLNK